MTLDELIEQLRHDLPAILFREPRGHPSAEREEAFLAYCEYRLEASRHALQALTRLLEDRGLLHTLLEDEEEGV